MTLKKRSFGLILMMLAVMLLPVFSAQADVELNRSGSVTIAIQTMSEVCVPNAKVELYHAGEAGVENGNLVYTLTSDFAASGADLSDLSDNGIGDQLYAHLSAHPCEPAASGVTDENGTVSFDVKPGLYLAVQNGFTEKMYFTEISPFFVCVPMMNEAGSDWTYDVTALPKVGELPRPTPTPAPTEPPKDDELPQTGLLRWPVPVLAVAGLVVFAGGWALCFMKKKEQQPEQNGEGNA